MKLLKSLAIGAAGFGAAMVIAGLNGLNRQPWKKPEVWHDPTHGRIDRDIQEYIARAYPGITLGQRVAIENTYQNKRDRGHTVYLGE